VPNLSPKRRIQIQVPRHGRADAAPLWRVVLSRQMLHQEHPIKLQVKKIGREGAAQQIGQMFDAVF
jgi:hypothetical protein